MPKRATPTDSVIWSILALIGISAAGFALGLKRIVWGIWIVVSIAWVALWLAAGRHAHDEAEVLYFLITWVPPVLVFLLIRLVSGIVDAVFGPIAAISHASPHPHRGRYLPRAKV